MTLTVDNQRCSLCGRRRELTFHHFIPRSLHSNKWFKKNYSWEQMKLGGATLCKDCHKYIHNHFTEKELGRLYNSLEKLQADPKICKFVAWVRKKKR